MLVSRTITLMVCWDRPRSSLLAVCLDLCTPLIEEGIAHVHSGAGMNRGSFRAGNTQGRQLRTGGDPRCDHVTEMVKGGIGGVPLCRQVQGVPTSRSEASTRTWLQHHGNLHRLPLPIYRDRMRPKVMLSELSGPRNLTMGSFSITARSSFPSPAMEACVRASRWLAHSKSRNCCP